MARSRESVLIRRDVVGELVPYGTPYELQEGQWAEITQALGTSFTLLVEGRLVRLGGADADAIGKDTPEAMTVEHDGDETTDEEIKRLIDEQLHTCYDPEIPVNIVDLGLVYKCELEPYEQEAGKLRIVIDMTLTAPGCGMGEVIANEVNDKLLNLPRIEEVTVNIVFDPPWDRSMMTEEANLALGL
ncbi:MAG: putative Fe-S cluster assembly protein SufT [Comamonas sp. SCN 67-35]|jgi:probable FeS assembly SUF system protein SufT|uniref:putative Fe-S cluster assembly protein SufT n=1 Tax=unclassified Comamonas TaxID=2638500 RepID=UPI00086F393D|nr:MULTISPECIES: putative Fe-S cluster assembly protein SufT [unclassified Comamonas]OJW98678.1 MAG: putative Fe-S cluster assembly protein SufT [Burkholderiales bacterium 66-26]MBN9330265.1 putative Fe-S cluster assembly protein SufT [Comamonas sp.]MBZ0225648.1 putative Fe-S cluster assembly protein SufT [Comamonas sp.]MCD6664136.1 putative Fe-S cluster assembly protein SufT [Comamonas sp.]ODU37915.1 MAG: putative Fe-S cluster assembly protein SufT [Comamonas sp. SCN 67-35]